MKEGFYWYRGPYFRDGEQTSPGDGQWSVVKIGLGYASTEQHLCYVGNDWDGDASDIAAMEKAGEFVLIEPPAERPA